MKLVALAIIIGLALIALAVSEHRPPNANLPVVKAGYDPLFAPCPLGPRNLPFRSERKA